MNGELRTKIKKVYFELQKEASASIIGKLNGGINNINESIPKSYSEFLNVCNGGRFGGIDLWSNELILDNEIEGKCFGNLDTFLNDYVFGKKYAEIIPDAEEEEWYIFLNKIKFI